MVDLEEKNSTTGAPMALLELGLEDALYYEETPPARAGAVSFVFVNPITGDVGLWKDKIVPALTAAGYGTLVYNFRGQANSPHDPGLALNDDLIVGDLMTLMAALRDRGGLAKPVPVGLSIGGLYAARAILGGAAAAGLVLINTLRRNSPRIAWMNDAALRVMTVGGPNLMKDLYFPLLMGEPFQAANRANFLLDEPDYEPLPEDSSAFNLLTHMGASDWEVDWSALDLPTLSVTGLQDRVFYDAAVVEELFASLPQGRRLDVAEAGHMLPLETPEPLIEGLLAFAKDL